MRRARQLPWIGAPRSARAYGVAFLCILAATLVRGLVQLVAPGAEAFALYLPAVFIATLISGVGPGLFALMLGGFTAWFLFLPKVFSFVLDHPNDSLSSLIIYFGAALVGWAAAAALRNIVDEYDRSEAAGRESSARLRRAQIGGGMGEWEVNLGDGAAVWSESMYALLGLDPATVQATPQAYYERIHRRDVERVYNAFTAAAETGASFDTEYRVMLPDGSRRWLLARGQREALADGRTILAGVNFDITDRKHLEQEVARKEQRHRTLLEAITSIVWTCDRDGNMTQPNAVFESYTGKAWPEYSARGWRSVFHPDDLPELEAVWHLAGVKSEPYEARGRLWHAPTQSWRYFLSRAVPLFDEKGKVEEWIGTLSDVHDLHIAGEQQQLLVGELRHRMKNMLMVIQALANRGKRTSPETAAFVETFTSRLKALSGAYDLLMRRDWSEAYLGDIAGQTLAPFHGCQSSSDGPRLALRSTTAVSVALALHELATNALKHGAWKSPEGRVKVEWRFKDEALGTRVEIDWIESGGPKIEVPTRQGFGSMMITNALAQEREGKVSVDYAPEGLRCHMSFLIDSKKRKDAEA